MAVYLLSVCWVDENETRHCAPVRPIRSCVRETLCRLFDANFFESSVFESGLLSGEAVTPRRLVHCRTHAELLHGVTSFRFWVEQKRARHQLVAGTESRTVFLEPIPLC
ncbi:MAG: hypothetical protein IT343_03975 [Candidatus Melainabacteria bacterium]|jgi:hypothetical protein|nr:hypothetical protein [Candidatus Melainabacteria bacterium]